VADLHSFLTSNLGDVGVEWSAWAPGRFSRNSPKRVSKQNFWWVPHLVWILLKTENPLDQRRTKPGTLAYPARSLATTQLQFAIISTSALQYMAPYPVIQRYQRWKPQEHSKRIVQSAGYFKVLQTTRKDVCSWHKGVAVKCCSLKLVRRNFINLAYMCSLPARLAHVFAGYIKQKVKTP
jgi:hypothetical protein